MKSIYEVSKRLVINEEIFVYISDGNLRYIEDKGDMYDTKEVVDVDYIRKMIIDEIIPWSKIKKSLIKKEEVFCFLDEFVVKIKSKKIQNAYIHTLFSKRNKVFTFEDVKKKLPLDEFVEYLSEQDQKIFLNETFVLLEVNKEMGRDTELKNAELYRENGEYFLDLTYVEKGYGNECELKIPKVSLNFLNSDFYLKRSSDGYFDNCSIEYCYPNHVSLNLFQDDNKEYFYQKPLKKKMTIKDIEKELGYEIELINEEEGE